MHRTLTNFGFVLANPPFVAGHDDLYRLVANVIADKPAGEHLPELVALFSAINNRIDLSQHWDCLCEALILEELQ